MIHVITPVACIYFLGWIVAFLVTEGSRRPHRYALVWPLWLARVIWDTSREVLRKQ